MSKIRILDLDLDYFLDGVVYWRDDSGERLDGSQYEPWPESRFRDFLEKTCGLSKSAQTPGNLCIDHHEVFFVNAGPKFPIIAGRKFPSLAKKESGPILGRKSASLEPL